MRLAILKAFGQIAQGPAGGTANFVYVNSVGENADTSGTVLASPADLLSSLFSGAKAGGVEPAAYAHVAEIDGQVVGIAIWFLNYSTWLGKAGLYLEDLFVKPEFRSRGLGLQLMKTLAQICVERGYERFQWWVLDWNEPSINFYKSIGADAMDQWTVYRLSGEALKNFAQ